MKQVELFNDHFQNFKVYGIPKAQLIIADPPYNLGVNAYASNPSWYVGGDNKNGESDKAGKEFFDTDLVAPTQVRGITQEAEKLTEEQADLILRLMKEMTNK